MITCPKCKTENIDSAKFCRSCGTNITQTVRKTNESVKQESEDTANGFKAIIWIIIIGAIIVMIASNSSESATTEAPAATEEIAPVAEEAYVRPSTAPNGQPWPVSAGYVDGYDKLNTKGMSSITVDNTQNDSDVFVKLYYLDAQQPHPVRHFFIPAYSSFTINKVNVGNYDVRYQDLGTGGLSRTEPFQIEEVDTGYGISYSNLTLTIYKVQNGNMETYGLNPSEF
jgi:hypothetical protein